MADPSTMAMIGIGSTALGGIFGAQGAQQKAAGQQLGIQGNILNTVGQIFNLQTTAEQYDFQANVNTYQAGVATANENLALQQAEHESDIGESLALARGYQEHADVSKAVVVQAASGLDISGGSAANVRASIVSMGQFDEATIRNNAAWKAYNYQIAAYQDKTQADLFTYGAQQDQIQKANTLQAAGLAEQAIPIEEAAYSLAGSAGTTAALGSIVGAAGSVASKWSTASNVGMTPSFSTSV